MTIHSQFWSPKCLENVKLVEIDSLLSCKTQEVPRHDILQGLESQPFRCASKVWINQYLYMVKSYYTGRSSLFKEVVYNATLYHALIVLARYVVHLYHCLVFLWYKARDCWGIGSDCRLAAPTDFIRGISARKLTRFMDADP